MKSKPWPFSDGMFFHCESKEEHKSDGTSNDLVIPSVLQKDVVSDLVASHMGVGRICSRYCHKDNHTIWCEWVGDTSFTNEGIGLVPPHEFSVVTFPYNYDLGRKEIFDCFRHLLPSRPHSKAEDTGSSKKRKSFSDPEDISVASTNLGNSAGEELSENDDQSVAFERMCDICIQKMLPDKDVAALLNRSTGKLVCSSRNFTGAFHVFHVSCLIHWILLCEVEIYLKRPVELLDGKWKPKRMVEGKSGRDGKESEMPEKRMPSVFCLECQGTGIKISEEQLEKPTVPLSEVFLHKMRLRCAHNEWERSPDVSQNFSIGLTFPLESDEVHQGDISSLKLLHFYRANVLMDDHKEADAISELNRAISFKLDLQLLHLRAAFHDSMGDYSSTLRDCEAALCLDPNHSDTIELYQKSQKKAIEQQK